MEIVSGHHREATTQLTNIERVIAEKYADLPADPLQAKVKLAELKDKLVATKMMYK